MNGGGQIHDHKITDSEALALVDSLETAVFFLERFGKGAKTWRAVFSFRAERGTWKDCEGRDESRAAAIFKAHTAAREWAAKTKKGES